MNHQETPQELFDKRRKGWIPPGQTSPTSSRTLTTNSIDNSGSMSRTLRHREETEVPATGLTTTVEAELSSLDDTLPLPRYRPDRLY